MDDLTGSRLNDYQLLRQLGRGAMASVYLAEQQSLARKVAVKVLAAELCREQTHVDRFQHEARAAASLVHPGIVQVYEVGVAESKAGTRHYLAQEYVAGGTLGREVSREGALAPGRVLEVLWQVGHALAAAAERGLVHRDIKPDNLMLDRSGAVKVADFGLARVMEASGPRMTQAGIAMGTPLYMSPEQIEGREVDARSDLYSLGITAYQLLAGEPPFTGDTPLSVAVQHLNNQPDPVSERRPNTPPALAAVIDRLIAKAPADRFQSPVEMLESLGVVAREGVAEGWASMSGALAGGSSIASTLSWAPRTSDDAEAVARLAAAMQSESGAVLQKRRRWRRRATALAVGALLGAVLVVTMAPRSPLLARANPVEKKETVKEQLYYAKLVDTPDAWQAVIDFHDEADSFYYEVARRGLAISALRDGQVGRSIRALEALESLPDSTNASGERITAVLSAARLAAYARAGEEDRVRTARASYLSLDPRAQQWLEQSHNDLWIEAQGVLARLDNGG